MPQALGAVGGELSPFYKGLGLDKANLGPLSPADLEAAGRAVRVALEGLFQLYAARSRAEERQPGAHGVVPVKDNNPLKTDWPADTKLQYLREQDVLGYAVQTARRNISGAIGAAAVSSSLTIVRRSDAATATLASLLSTNNNKLTLTLSIYRAGGDTSRNTDPMIQFLYEGARIAEMLMLTGGATGMPCEVIRFSFRQLTIESAPQTGTGARGAVRTSTFSMAD